MSLKSKFLSLISPPDLRMHDEDEEEEETGRDGAQWVPGYGNGRNVTGNEANSRRKRDFSTMTKFIETALILDKAMV